MEDMSVSPQTRYRRRNAVRIKEEALDYIKSSKDQPCMDCGVQYPTRVMEFDHVRGPKFYNIARMVSRFPVSSIACEIAKCDVVCANCHRLRHLEDQCN